MFTFDPPVPARKAAACRKLLDTISTHLLWRHVDPGDLKADGRFASLLADRLQGAVRNATFTWPELRETIDGLVGGDLRLLMPILGNVPDDAGQTAAYDLRMTLVLWSVARAYHPKLRFGSGPFPLGPGLMAAGLRKAAEATLPGQPALLALPRRKRDGKQRAAVIEWRKERSRLRRLALAWVAHDPIRGSGPKDFEGRDAIGETIEILKAARQRLEPSDVKAAPVPDDIPAGCPTFTVIDRPIPPVKGGRDSLTKAEVDYWNRLARPLALKGGDVRPDAFADALNAEFPWMGAVIERIAGDLQLRRLAGGPGWFHFRPLLMVGPPGIGKTRFVRRLAEQAGLGMRVINLGGSADNRDLQGTARGWSTAEPSAVLRAIRDADHANPIVFVDEVEKAGGSNRNGRVQDTLLAMLEPESARQWYDECLMVPADLAAINWILAANSLDGIPEPLLSRMAVIEIGGPGREDFQPILQGLLRDIAREHDTELFALPELNREAVGLLREHFLAGVPIRRIKAAVVSAVAAALAGPRILH